MAWYALCKWFIPWRKTPYQDMISCFKKFLYDEWFESLSNEEKEKIHDLKIKKVQRAEEALVRLGEIYSAMNQKSGGRMNDCMRIAKIVDRIGIHPSKYW